MSGKREKCPDCCNYECTCVEDEQAEETRDPDWDDADDDVRED